MLIFGGKITQLKFLGAAQNGGQMTIFSKLIECFDFLDMFSEPKVEFRKITEEEHWETVSKSINEVFNSIERNIDALISKEQEPK